MAAPMDLELKKVKKDLKQVEASLRKLRELWTRILSEAQVLQKKARGSRALGNGFTAP